MTGVTRAAEHRTPADRRVYAGSERSGGVASGAAGIPSLYRIHEMPDPKRVSEFEELASHFGYSLGIGALPVKRFAVVKRHRDGRKTRRDIVLPDESFTISSRNYQKLIAADCREAGRAHSQLPDAAVAEAGALQQRQHRTLCLGRAQLHALHVAHSPLSRPGCPPHPDDYLDHQRAVGRAALARDRGRSAPSPNAGPPMRNGNWWSGRRSSSCRTAWARSSTR